MKSFRYSCTVAGFALVAACAKEPPPPPSVDEFLANRVLLDATMAKCLSDRPRMKYEPECVNAREAANAIARAEEAERRLILEARSERKRAALRRAQEAAEEARRRAEEAARRRREEEYLGLFEPAVGEAGNPDAARVVPDASEGAAQETDAVATTDVSPGLAAEAATDGSAETAIAPDAQPPAPTENDATPDLGEIRDELRRRNDGSR